VETTTIERLVGAAIAIGIGLFVGLEREHSDVEEQEAQSAPREVLLGVRTFALLSLFGWVCSLVATWLAAVGLVVVAGLVGLQFFRVVKESPGLTTEIAAVVTFVLGALVHHDRLLAVSLGLVITFLLISKPWVRRTVPKLRRVELTATLQLAIILAVVLPLLPTEPVDPWGALSPRKLGLFVVLIAGVSYVGYVLSRLFGRRRGIGLAGLVGGLASSTAVTAAMAQQARKVPETVVVGQLAVFLANTVMFGRVLVVAAVIDMQVALGLLVPLGAMGLVMLGAALWRYQVARKEKPSARSDDEALSLRNPFALLPALTWGLVLAVVLLVSALAQQAFGDRGFYLAAAASGLADVDAITLAATERAGAGSLSPGVARLAITIAVVSNTVVKAALAWMSGGRRFALPVAVVFGAVAAVGIALAAITR
jgi:uncharacterized membrane protein (DUF4010 family)